MRSQCQGARQKDWDWPGTIGESTHCKEVSIYVFPEKELRKKKRSLSTNFRIHVFVSDLYIPTIGPPIFLQQNRQTDRALLQGLTWFSATQTGCRWLISYIEQKKFLACDPEISVDFSAPPEFSGGVMEKCLNTG